MAKNKFSLDFSNFADYAEQLENLGGDLKRTADKALQETHKYITDNLERDIKKHHRSGKLEKSLLRDSTVEWSGNIAEIDVGFDIANGGLSSVFLMYGTPKHAPANQYGSASGENPGMQANKELYNDIYGARTKREVKKIQEKIFADEIHKRMGG